MSSRPVTRQDFPDTDGRWRASVDAKLRRLFTLAAKQYPAIIPDGTIPVTALAKPFSEPGFVSLTQTGFAVPAGPGRFRLAVDVAVPLRGFTSCVVTLTGRVNAVNGTGSAGFLSAQVSANGASGNAVPLAAAPGEAALNVATLATPLTGLDPGTTFPVALEAWTDAADWAASGVALADLTGLIAWFE